MDGAAPRFALPTAAAAPVHGVVHLPDEETVQRATRRTGYWRVPNGVLPLTPPAHDPRADAVVVLVAQGTVTGDQASALAEAETDKRAVRARTEVHLSGARLSPAVLIVAPGTTITVFNDDPHQANLSCPRCGTGLHDPIPPAGKIALTLASPGEYSLSSPDLPHLHGTVLVVERAYPGRVEPSGAFSMDVPEGQYKTRLWLPWPRPGTWIDGQQTEIGPKGAEIELHADLPTPATSERERERPAARGGKPAGDKPAGDRHGEP